MSAALTMGGVHAWSGSGDVAEAPAAAPPRSVLPGTRRRGTKTQSSSGDASPGLVACLGLSSLLSSSTSKEAAAAPSVLPRSTPGSPLGAELPSPAGCTLGPFGAWSGRRGSVA